APASVATATSFRALSCGSIHRLGLVLYPARARLATSGLLFDAGREGDAVDERTNLVANVGGERLRGVGRGVERIHDDRPARRVRVALELDLLRGEDPHRPVENDMPVGRPGHLQPEVIAAARDVPDPRDPPCTLGRLVEIDDRDLRVGPSELLLQGVAEPARVPGAGLFESLERRVVVRSHRLDLFVERYRRSHSRPRARG